MSVVLKYVDQFHEFLDKNADERTTNWFMMGSPFPTIAICLAYVYLVKVVGPKLMENRKPFQLKEILIAYNFFQVIFSTYLFIESLRGGWWGKYNFHCQPVDYSDTKEARIISMSGWLTGEYSLRCQPVDRSHRPQVLRMTNVCWWYFISKFTELFDTIFFVLRKKNDHISTLHVIHHGCMPMSVWFGVKFTPGGHSTFFGLLNTFVHIIMYSYYLLAALGPSIQPYLWWKKYLTALQMVQFIAIIVHAFQLIFVDCGYPKAFAWWIGLHAIMFFFLFNNFYKQKYTGKDSKSRAKHAAISAINAAAGACMANGLPNGKNHNSSPNGTTQTKRRDAADYYVKGEIATNDVNLRKPYTATE